MGIFVESEVVELKAEVVGDICKQVVAFFFFLQHKRRHAIYSVLTELLGDQKHRPSHVSAKQYDSRFY